MSDVIEVPLTQGKVALIDECDADLVLSSRNKWKVRLSRRSTLPDVYYAERNLYVGVGHKQMHRLILDADPGMWVDHANGDGLDNRRSNLRLVTPRQNAQNRRFQGGASRFKGVTWNASSGKWQVMICVNGRHRYLGVFADEEEAARVYDRTAAEEFGEFAVLNGVLL